MCISSARRINGLNCLHRVPLELHNRVVELGILTDHLGIDVIDGPVGGNIIDLQANREQLPAESLCANRIFDTSPRRMSDTGVGNGDIGRDHRI